MSFFAEIFVVLMTFAVICLLAAISCRLIELLWMATYACFAPLMCPNRRREPWPAELCNILIILIILIDNTLFKWCGLWCDNISRKLRRCKTKLKLCKIHANKKFDKIRVKPIIYDDVHIIVVNPYDKYQIATVSKEVNTMEV
tara:strand:- start:1137 stop:1565 length:429 start_codon:yes stop_codon:yes gene_type:complete